MAEQGDAPNDRVDAAAESAESSVANGVACPTSGSGNGNGNNNERAGGDGRSEGARGVLRGTEATLTGHHVRVATHSGRGSGR